jgi:hypothetical protein
MRSWSRFFLWGLLTLAGGLGAADHPAVLRAEFLNDRVPYPSCHASTIVEAAPGALVATWFGGTREGNPDVGIWVSRLRDGKWTPSVEVANGAETEEPRNKWPDQYTGNDQGRAQFSNVYGTKLNMGVNGRF